jgi:hypothetical protein
VIAVLVIAAAAALIAPERPVTACGPDFPTNMIVRRADALATMWDGSFDEEARKLVTIPERDRVMFTSDPLQIPASAREQALYSAAAEKFHAGNLDGAADGFRAVLRLPVKERRRFSVAAAFSLGRTEYVRWNSDAAIAAFREVRALVRSGAVDDQSLAQESLGEEARVERERHGDLVATVHLYAQQAALGTPGSEASLLFVVRGASAAQRAALYRDDVGTRLLALYFYTRGLEITTSDGDPDIADQATWRKDLAKRVTSEARGAAYLAAAAYRNGEWDAAAKLAGMCRHAPIATWVQAKLALRDGDRARADALLHEVERAGLTGNGPDSPIYYSIDSDPRSLIRGELGLVALADQRFVDAADWFVRGTRMIEAAYVAERAMSLDELLAAVQRTQDARIAPLPKPAADDSTDPCDDWEPVVGDHSACWGRRLLEIYARRLMRVQRYDAALDAFADSAPAAAAKDFVAAIKRADASSGIERAEHLYRAARTLRTNGMEIAGTEVGPDWHAYAGDYERETLCMPSPTAGYMRFAVPDDDHYDDPADGCILPTKGDAALVSPLEATRVTASAPELDQRFSYRYVASRLAETAANLVPPRSQAYAETLCWAALFARRDRSRVADLYSTYVRNGAYGFSSEFGESCEEPDFHRARTFDDDQHERAVQSVLEAERERAWTWPRIRAAAWRHKRWLAIPLIAIGLLLLVRRRYGPSLGAL